MRGLFALLLCASAAHAAPSVFVEGRFTSDGVGVDDVVALEITLRGADGASLLELPLAGVVLVDGNFAVEVDLAGIEAEVAAGDVAFEVRIDDATAAAHLGSVHSVARATRADVANGADSADRLGFLEADELVSISRLALPGGPPLTFANLTNEPPGLTDGDQGNVDVVGGGLVLVGGELRIANASVTASVVVDRSIATAAIADGTVTNTQLGALEAADFAAGTLTGADFGPTSVTVANLDGTEVDIFLTAAGCQPSNPEFSLTSSCNRVPFGCRSGQVKNCTTGVCETTTSTTCSNARLGELLFAR